MIVLVGHSNILQNHLSNPGNCLNAEDTGQNETEEVHLSDVSSSSLSIGMQFLV